MKSPALNKQEDWYIFEQLVKFKNDIRGNNEQDTEGKLMGLMEPMAKTLTDKKAMKDVVAYIQTLNK